MKKFMLFIGGLIALFVLLANLGPMILLGVSVWLLYIIFKKFVNTGSTGKKILWVILGLIVLSISVSNIWALIGFAAAYLLYFIYNKWKEDKQEERYEPTDNNDPFTNFEKQWAKLNH